MEQKLVKVPFDVELAKRIQSGECEGRIVTRDGENVRILCFDRKGTELPIVALVEIKCGVEDYFHFILMEIMIHTKIMVKTSCSKSPNT